MMDKEFEKLIEELDNLEINEPISIMTKYSDEPSFDYNQEEFVPLLADMYYPSAERFYRKKEIDGVVYKWDPTYRSY